MILNFFVSIIRNKTNYYLNMSRDEINSRVKNVIAQVLEKNVDEIGDEANFVTDLGATSIQSIRLVAGFEEEFNIEMDEDKSLQVQTVSGAVKFISSYVIPVQ
jgi:acyl carrier protein